MRRTSLLYSSAMTPRGSRRAAFRSDPIDPTPRRGLLAQPLALLAAGVLSSACAASSRERYGPVALFDPNEQAWVAQGQGKLRFVLRHPLSGCVLRCREDVERWKGFNVEASRLVNKNGAAMPHGMLITLPLSAPGIILMVPAAVIAQALAISSADLRKAADAARKAGPPGEAIDRYLQAFWAGDNTAGEVLAELFLEQGRTEDAALARRQSVCRGARLGEAAWAQVAAWLKAQGQPLGACQDSSRAPVELPWVD